MVPEPHDDGQYGISLVTQRDRGRLSAAHAATSALAAQLAAIQHDASLVEPGSFVARDVTLQHLRSQIACLDELIAAANPGEQQRLSNLKRDALRAISLLQEADAQLFAAYRHQIREGTLSPSAFRALLHGCALPNLPETWTDPPRYDHLDRLLDGILQIDAPPSSLFPIGPEMIPYQATPLRILLDMADRLALTPDDVFYDLGAGLGRVVFGMALMSPGHMKGVEVEPAYVEYAQQRAQELNLGRVSFVNADVRALDYADGTVFFLYTPFKGATLRHVLALLRVQARRHRIRVCTYGPGTLEVQDEDWLTSDDDPERDIHYVTIFESTWPRRRIPVARHRL